jgi:hypothetical protein
MNEKIKAILLKIVIALKKQGWTLDKDYELTLKSEGHIPIKSSINVQGALGDNDRNESIETILFLKLDSDDQITFYPEYQLSAELFVQGGDIEHISNTFDSDVAFTEDDFRNDEKIAFVAKKIDFDVESQVQSEYENYLDKNGSDITQHNSGGWKADDDAYFDR